MAIAAAAYQQIFSGLCERIDILARELPHLSLGQLCTGLDDIRRTAAAYDIQPVAQLARGLETVLARSDGQGMALAWLDTMRDAAASGRIDRAASETYLAALSIRLAH